MLGLAALAILAWSIRRAEAARTRPAGEVSTARLAATAGLGLAAVFLGALALWFDYVAVSLPFFAAGLGAWNLVARGHEGHGHEAEGVRRIVGATRTAMTASLLAGVLLVGNMLAYKYADRPIDLSRDRIHSLSSLSRNQLTALDRPVLLTAFFGSGPRATPQHARVLELLELYRAAAPKWIATRSLNPFTEPERFEELTRGAPDVALGRGGGVVIEYGQGASAVRRVVRNEDLFGVEPPSSGEPDPTRFASSFRGEDAITSSLGRLREGDRVRVGFTTGHGEPSSLSAEPRLPAVGQWRARLMSVGAEVGEVDTKKDIPGDLALLAIVAPKTPFLEDEIARIRTHLDRGKPVLVVLSDARRAGLVELLKTYRIEVGAGVVVDPTLNHDRRDWLVYAPIGAPTRHPIVDTLAGRSALLPNAAPLRVVSTGDAINAPAGVVVEPILKTGPKSWVEKSPDSGRHRFDPEDDTAGPVVVALAVSSPARPGEAKGKLPGDSRQAVLPRMVVVSSGFAGDNDVLEREPTNLDFLMNAAQWLRGQPDLIGIAPKTYVASTLAASPARRSRLVLVPTVLAAVVIVGLGLATSWTRRA